jgi:hypothetical protein
MTTAAVYPSTTSSSFSLATFVTIPSPDAAVAPPVGYPVSVSHSQLYYWSAKWQHDEGESLAEIDTGEALRFSNGRDAIRWLLSSDD